MDRYGRACAHSDATIAELDLDVIGHVPSWPRPDVSLHSMLVHVLSETSRHAGHADIVREHLDGAAGWSPTLSQVVVRDATAWERYRARIDAAARSFETR